MMSQHGGKQIINLWIGKQSQQCAFSFYNLQAEQIFNENDDHQLHSSLWRDLKKMQPRGIIFDTKIQRLAAVREVNNQRMINKMKTQTGWQSMMGMFGNVDAKPLQSHEQTDMKQWAQHSNWKDHENNYFLIDQNYSTLPKQQQQKYSLDLQSQRYQVFEQFYTRNAQGCENKIRKQLQKTDHLKAFTICSDESYFGFTGKIIEYLRQECPKQGYFMTSLNQNGQIPVFSTSKLYDEVDILLPIDLSIENFRYFGSGSIYNMLAPYFCSLYTPFYMKDVDPSTYISTIVTDNRKLFNSAYTLPIIDEQQCLNKETNIFRFEQAAFLRVNPDKQWKHKDKKENNEDQEEKEQLKINFTNQSYLSLGSQDREGKFVSQSYVLKGHFNNFQKIFTPKSQPSSLSIKYLQAIFAAPSEPQFTYNSFYNSQYGKQVEAYPYHLTMFSHETFGKEIRRHLQKVGKSKIFNEELEQCKEKLLVVADSYKELNEDSD